MRALTVDLEDWFQVYNFSSIIKQEDWDRQRERVIRSTDRLLDILDNYDTKATFFVLGWIAERYPFLISEIASRGHEIACHGYNHKPIFFMSKEEFGEDIEKSVKAIKKACGIRPKGYRAPSFSITKKTLWALDILKEKGFEYDSSMMPTDKHPDYGIKGIPRKLFMIKGIKEIPLTTVHGLPIGGGYFRAYPYFLTRYLLKKDKNSIFYIHPWEFDPGIPRYKLPLLKRFRHYVGLRRTRKKFKKLLRDFRFGKIEEILVSF